MAFFGYTVSGDQKRMLAVVLAGLHYRRFVNRWDLEYLLDVLSMALDDRSQYPSPQSKAYLALKVRA